MLAKVGIGVVWGAGMPSFGRPGHRLQPLLFGAFHLRTVPAPGTDSGAS